MRIGRTLLALTPLALIALASCGGESQSSSAPSPSSSGSAQSQSSSGSASSSSAPSSEISLATPRDYFDELKNARKRTSEADNLRIYTPHANVYDNIPENGYLQFLAGFHVDVDANAEGGTFSGLSDLENADVTVSVEAMPFDMRANNMQGDNKNLLFSFANSIEERDGKFTVSLNNTTILNNRFTTEFYIEDGMFYANLSSINALLVLLTSERLPGKGKMAFDLPSTYSVKDLIDFSIDEDNEELYSKMDEFLSEAGLSYNSRDLIRIFSDLDYEIYSHTDSKLWTLENNTIKLEINSEEQYRAFSIALYESSRDDITEEEKKDFIDSLDKTLDYIDFDHLKVENRFSEKGLAYNHISYKINGFDDSKKPDLGYESSYSLYPMGAWEFSLGLAYQYEGVEAKKLTDEQKSKYEYMDTSEIVRTILDEIRQAMERAKEEETSSAA